MPRLRLRLIVLGFGLVGLVNLWAAPPATLQQLAELTPSVRAANDWFGFSIAVSRDTVVVGDFDANIESFGAVYVYVKPASGWANMTQVAKLTSSDNGEGFGTSVSINGNTIVVGAANTSNFHAPAAGPGAAYVFVRPSGGWADMTETAKLTASDGQPGDAFGDSVSISGNIIAVGAFFAVDSSNNGFAGKAYVFSEPAGGWAGNLNQTARLTASDSQLLNYMGASIAINDRTIVVGAYGHNNFQGAAYVFLRPGAGWADMTQTAELTASDGKGSNDFGFSAAIAFEAGLHVETIILGAPGAARGSGAAYVFVQPSAGWTNMTQTAELRTTLQGSGFGQSVSLAAKRAMVGAPSATINGNFGQGAAFVFARPSAGWTNTSHSNELTASDGAGNDNFGLSVGLSGTTFVVGQIGNSNPGTAYVFGP